VVGRAPGALAGTTGDGRAGKEKLAMISAV
jgi:hypothetical protein